MAFIGLLLGSNDSTPKRHDWKMQEFSNKEFCDIPLLVDLDGSVLSTDTLLEMLVQFIRQNPVHLILVVYWFIKGKTVLKQELAERVRIDLTRLPYRQEVLEFLTDEKKDGRRLVLFTGTWKSVAEEIFGLYPIFDSTVASTADRNLTGEVKRAVALECWGHKGFDYLGNEEKDLSVWRECRQAIVVGSNDLKEKASGIATIERHFLVDRITLRVFMKSARVHQWAKNALIFVPLFTAQQFTQASSVFNAVIAFLVFCLISSATYLINDLFDLDSDRKHETKRFRPLASGLLSISNALGIIAALGFTGLVLSIVFLPPFFSLSLFLYIALTLLYSYKLKRLQTIDVISLASLFTLRVIAGAAAIGVVVSFWLLSFSMFIFLSLALVKRVTELNKLVAKNAPLEEKIAGRGYYASDIAILQNLGSTSGFLAVLVFAFYINSNEVTSFYDRPEILWLICPILGYWIMRIWIMTARSEMEEDPIYFAITDRNSWLAALVMALVLLAAYLY